MNKRNIDFLKRNLSDIIKFLSQYSGTIWRVSYPPSVLGEGWYSRDISATAINRIKRIEEFALYIHIPFCKNKCDYCKYYAPYDISKIGSKNYVDCLKKELENILKISEKRKILAILIGGGTPSLLKPNDIKNLMSFLRKNFVLPRKDYITIEVAPADISQEMARAIVESGIGRVCLGVQTFNENKLRSVNRLFQKISDVYNAVCNFKEAGFENFAFDLIYGLDPNESSADFLSDNLGHILRLRPRHINLFPLQNYEKFPQTAYRFSFRDLKIIKNKINSELNKMAKGWYVTPERVRERFNADNFPSELSYYSFLRQNLAENILAIGFNGYSNFWLDGKFIGRVIVKSPAGLKGYIKDAKMGRFTYDYYELPEDDSLKKYMICSLGLPYGLDELVIREKFPNSLDLFYQMIAKIKDILFVSNKKFFLEEDYVKNLPFKTKNDYVNYFIFSLCYLYSFSDQEKFYSHILKKIKSA